MFIFSLLIYSDSLCQSIYCRKWRKLKYENLTVTWQKEKHSVKKEISHKSILREIIFCYPNFWNDSAKWPPSYSIFNNWVISECQQEQFIDQLQRKHNEVKRALYKNMRPAFRIGYTLTRFWPSDAALGISSHGLKEQNDLQGSFTHIYNHKIQIM